MTAALEHAATRTGVAFTAGGAITYNGWTVQISRHAARGRHVHDRPNTNGDVGQPQRGRLADLQVANTLNGGTASYQAAYGAAHELGRQHRRGDGDRVGRAGNDRAALRARSQQSLSGVNLDEEAANLLRYQQAYQASGKVIEVARRCSIRYWASGS